jgi:predicted ATPase
MAKKVEDPKKLAAKIAKTKALAGGREVTVNATPSAGMPGSGKSAMLSGVVITDKANKPAEEKKYTVGQYLVVGKNKYPKRELMDALKKENLLKYTGESGYFNSDGKPLAEYVIKKYKIPVYNEALRTKAQADSIFATGKSN